MSQKLNKINDLINNLETEFKMEDKKSKDEIKQATSLLKIGKEPLLTNDIISASNNKKLQEIEFEQEPNNDDFFNDLLKNETMNQISNDEKNELIEVSEEDSDHLTIPSELVISHDELDNFFEKFKINNDNLNDETIDKEEIIIDLPEVTNHKTSTRKLGLGSKKQNYEMVDKIKNDEGYLEFKKNKDNLKKDEKMNYLQKIMFDVVYILLLVMVVVNTKAITSLSTYMDNSKVGLLSIVLLLISLTLLFLYKHTYLFNKYIFLINYYVLVSTSFSCLSIMIMFSDKF